MEKNMVYKVLPPDTLQNFWQVIMLRKKSYGVIIPS